MLMLLRKGLSVPYAGIKTRLERLSALLADQHLLTGRIYCGVIISGVPGIGEGGS